MKIVVLGGGFAGRAALQSLASLASGGEHEVTLIDRNTFTTMLLSLPDVAGGRIREKYITEDLLRLVPDNVKIVQDTIAMVDFDAKTLQGEKETYSYDYLVLAAGSTTNFYNFKESLDKLYRMDSIQEALRLREDFRKRLETNTIKTVVIVGAGFTGLETACGLRWAAKKAGANLRYYLVEKTANVLPMLSKRTGDYVKSKMTALGFEFLTENEVTSYDGINITLKGGQNCDQAILIWTGGMKAAVRLSGKHGIIADGRVTVDDNLRIPAYPEVFVAGDFAAFKQKETYLRRAAFYASNMGSVAGKNARNAVQGKPLKKFTPFDPGWVIPLYITSVGNFLGVPITGRLGVLAHYFVTGIRNFNVRNMLAYFTFAIRFLFDRK